MDRLASTDGFSKELEALLDNLEAEKGKEDGLNEIKQYLRRYVQIKETLDTIPEEHWVACDTHCAMYTSNHGNVFVFRMLLEGGEDSDYIWEVITPISTVIFDKPGTPWDVDTFIERHQMDRREKGILYPLLTFIDGLDVRQLVFENHNDSEHTYQIAVGKCTISTIRFNSTNRLRFEARIAESLLRH